MIDTIICWWKGHDIEKDFYRNPVHQYWKMNRDNGKYYKVDIVDDQNVSEYWCHRCCKYNRHIR